MGDAGEECPPPGAESQRVKIASVAEWKPPREPEVYTPSGQGRENMPRVVIIFGKDS